MSEMKPEPGQIEDAFLADLPDIVGGMIAEREAEEEAAVQALVNEEDPPEYAVDRDPFAGIPETETMDDDDLVSAAEEQLRTSLDGTDGELSGNWRNALRYYYGSQVDPDRWIYDGPGSRPRGCVDRDTGTSATESLDVADVIEALLAEIMPTFDGDAIFRFGAVGSTDEELKADESRAEDESELVNWVLLSENPGYVELQSMFRDALLQRMGVIKVEIQQEISVDSSEYSGLSEMELRILNSDPDVMLYRSGDKIVANRYAKRRRVRIESVPPEELKITGSWRSPFLDDVPFIAHDRIVRCNELIESGYPKDLVEEIPTHQSETNDVSIERSLYPSEDDWDENLPGSRPVRISTCYMLIDYDGDGISERRKVVIGGQSILLENVAVSEQPFAMAVPILRPHRMTGLSMYDRMKDIQDSKTEILNQTVDNLRWCNMPDADVLFRQVDMTDVLSRRPGGVNVVKTAGAINRNPPIQIGNDAYRFMEYMDKLRSERGGASLDLQSAQMQIAGDTAHGIERQISAREKMASFIATTMVRTGVVPMIRKIHAALRENGERISGRSVGSSRGIVADPAQWPERREVFLTNSITLGDRMRRQQALSQILGIQKQLMDSGMSDILTDLPGISNALLDATKIAGLTNPRQYWVDPESPRAQQAVAARTRAEQQATQAQQQQQAQQQELLLQLESMRAEVAQMREQTRFVLEAAKLRQKTQSEAAQLAEDARQANQDAAVDLTKEELEYGRNVPGSVV